MIIIINLTFNLIFSQNTQFKADKYTNIYKEDTLILEGSVHIISDSNNIKAEKVKLNTKTNDFKAENSVTLESKDINIKADTIEGNLKTELGILINAEVNSKFDSISGNKINKIDNYKYKLEDGSFTSCKNKPAAWEFYGKNMDVDFKGYAKIEDGLLKSNDFPLLYFPYLVLPLMQDRQTGLLIPRFGFSNEGFNIEQDLFIVVDRSNDITITAGHYQNRGYLTGLEYRTRFSDESYFDTNFFNIFDDTFKNITFENNKLNRAYRNSIKADAVFKIEDNTYFKSNIRYVSDTNIPRDFHNKIEGNLDPALENKFFIYKHTNNLIYSASINYYQNLINPNPVGSNNIQMHKLPELNIKTAKYKYEYFMFENDISYLNIYRPKSSFDDLNNNNIFDDGDKIRNTQVFSVYPRLSLPIALKYITITPAYGFRYDYYVLEEINNSSRAINEFKLNLKQDLSKTYIFNSNSRINSLKHNISPYMEYTYNNEFVHLDPLTPKIRSIDYINFTNYIKYGLSNRVTATIKNKQIKETCNTCNKLNTEEEDVFKEDLNYTTSIIQPLSWDLYQVYDIENSKFHNAYSNLWFKYSMYNLILRNYYNVDTRKIASSISAILNFDKYYYTNLAYTVDKTKETAQVDQVRLGFGFKYWQFYSNLNIIYNNLLDGSLKNKIQEQYFDISYMPKSSCWFFTSSFSNRYDKPGTEINFLINFIVSGQNIGLGNDLKFLNTM